MPFFNTITEPAYFNGLLAVVFAPYCLLAGLIWIPGWGRRLLVASIVLFAHAGAVIGYVAVASEGVHRGDAGLGDVVLVFGCVGFNWIVALIAGLLACLRYKLALIWVAAQLLGDFLIFKLIFK
jgi:hypothetical protein